MSTPISVVGTVATDPRLVTTASGLSVCSFRLAAGERRFNRERQEWEDGETSWYSVSVFRKLAEHAHRSFRKGERVIVAGRLRVRDWETTERSGTSADVEADALGHDVRWGVSTFQKTLPAEPPAEDSPEPPSERGHEPAEGSSVPEEVPPEPRAVPPLAS